MEATVNQPEDPVFTTDEAARELKVSISFLAKARMTGTGPAFIRLGRAIRYRKSALEAYKTAHTRTCTSQHLPRRLSRSRSGVELIHNKPQDRKKNANTNNFSPSQYTIKQDD
jgi:hypothetical protein